MPWSVAKSDRCPTSRPWAVIKDADGSIEGCHATKADANKQLAALNATESNGDAMVGKLKVREKPPKLCYRSVEFRATEPATDGRTLEGYGAVFNDPTTIETFFGDFEEEIARGAFTRTLDAKMPVLQFDHGRDMRTGSIPIGTINELYEDSRGLFVSARLFDNDVVDPIRQAIEAGAISGMSFRFRIMREEWRDANGTKLKSEDELLDILLDPDSDRGPARRTIREVELFELGPVVFPAYDATSVGVRSLLAALDGEERDALVRELVNTVQGERTAVSSHDTSTVDQSWDASANVTRLSSPMSLSTARAMYAWYDSDRVEDGEIVKAACSLPHHEVSADGSPGSANLNAVRNALSRLPQSDIPESDHEAVRRHLNNHLPSDDNEASSESAVTGTSDAKADPAVRHSADLGEPADWYLPGPSEVL